MKRVLDTGLVVGITFLVTLFLNATINYFTQPRANVLTGSITSVQGRTFALVEITNFTFEPLNSLVLSVPKTLDLGDLVFSNPTRVESIPDASGTDLRKHISISGFEPSRVTVMLVPISQPSDLDLIRVVNAHQLHITETSTTVDNPYDTLMRRAAETAIIYSIFVAIGYYWQDTRASHRQEDLTKQIQEHKEQVEAVQKQLTDVTTKISEIHREGHRIRIFYLKRLSDATKELDFWRDTVRKMLYQTCEDKNVSERLINHVTNTLKTYSTRSEAIADYDTIDALAGFMAQHDPKDGR